MDNSKNVKIMHTPKHGGRLQEAVVKFGIPRDKWMDLSTGINPYTWPVTSIPTSIWSRLPEPDEELVAAASNYYNSENILPVSGSQAAISALPKLRKLHRKSRVGVIAPGYAEHAFCWQQAGHKVIQLTLSEIEKSIDTIDVLVIINPNNPTGEIFTPGTLLKWREQLSLRGGWLIVDEAFMDCTPEYSVAQYSSLPGLIVLRSLGKFFGLAGIRVGFVCAENALLGLLNNYMGPWAVTGPSQYIANKALQDCNWHSLNRKRIFEQAQRLGNLLYKFGLVPTGATSLFHWVVTERAYIIHEALSCRGILTRLFHTPLSLRFGLPGSEENWQRLENALQEIKNILPPYVSSPNLKQEVLV